MQHCCTAYCICPMTIGKHSFIYYTLCDGEIKQNLIAKMAWPIAAVFTNIKSLIQWVPRGAVYHGHSYSNKGNGNVGIWCVTRQIRQVNPSIGYEGGQDILFQIAISLPRRNNAKSWLLEIKPRRNDMTFRLRKIQPKRNDTTLHR